DIGADRLVDVGQNPARRDAANGQDQVIVAIGGGGEGDRRRVFGQGAAVRNLPARQFLRAEGGDGDGHVLQPLSTSVCGDDDLFQTRRLLLTGVSGLRRGLRDRKRGRKEERCAGEQGGFPHRAFHYPDIPQLRTRAATTGTESRTPRSRVAAQG